MEENEGSYTDKIDSLNKGSFIDSDNFTQLSFGRDEEQSKEEKEWGVNKKAADKIRTLPIESMSPIEVMNFVYELKQSLDKEEV